MTGSVTDWDKSSMARILVVDDEEALARMIAALVADMGHEPIMASDGQEALALLLDAADPPALIISDIMMPHMGGVELAHAVKESKSLHTIPVVLMTAGGHVEDGAVADHCIYKPFDLSVIEELIQTYVLQYSRR